MSSTWPLIQHSTVTDGAGNPSAPATSALVPDGVMHAVGMDVNRRLVPRGATEALREIDVGDKLVEAWKKFFPRAPFSGPAVPAVCGYRDGLWLWLTGLVGTSTL